MMANKYFHGKMDGLNADIERHRQKQAELEAKITELEGKTDGSSIIYLNTYRHLLNQLLQSKAEVTSKIGKKK